MVKTVYDTDFEQKVLKSDKPTLVHFMGTWSRASIELAPILNQLSAKYAGQVNICALDIDESPDTVLYYNIRGVPSLLIFKGGKEVDRKIGLQPQSTIAIGIDSFL